jgi:phosphoheptose isomerase
MDAFLQQGTIELFKILAGSNQYIYENVFQTKKDHVVDVLQASSAALEQRYNQSVIDALSNGDKIFSFCTSFTKAEAMHKLL